MTTSLLFALSLTLGCSLAARAAEFPDERWAAANAIEAGLNEATLLRARDYALAGGGSGYIVRHGKLVLSWGSPTQRYDLKSTTKSFGAAALGLAIKDGKIRLEDKLRLHHPAVGATNWLDEITIFHLASQTAGFDKPGGYVPVLFKPGTQWAYSDSGPNWLAECITLTYQRDLDELMFERLFAPIGITRADLTWRKNQYRPDSIDGIERREFGAGISANVDAMARFGLLWLRGGEWKGAQLLPRDFIELARKPAPGIRGLPVRKQEDYGRASDHYGLLWWNNADSTIEGVPPDTYWSWGLYDSLIVIMPTLDIVVSRAGKSWPRSKGADHYEVLKPFLQPIAAAAGYKTSPVIQRVEWAPTNTIIRLAKGSDNWPMTWADDNALYTAYGDGNGFAPFVKSKLSLGLAKVIGDPPNIRGVNIRSETAEALGDGKYGRKASGMLCVDGILYMLVRNVTNSQLGWSSDHGATWIWANWKFGESFGCPTFLNFGANYAGARDNFVYVYSHDHDTAYEKADRFVLARAPKHKILDRSAWEFFVNESRWSTEIRGRGDVLVRAGACYRSGITYNAPLKRYLWVQTGTGKDTRFAGGFAIYDAPEPWGAWTVAFDTEEWDVGPGETASIPTKWISLDGHSFYLVFSGDDCFSVRQCKLILRD